ncbi:MAG: hypothetical protein OMM_01609 [Candidatus Magnetoglobus multicellularis str. Araruama]|uniref:Uncharacterized protein n=1 Tax=Candidatus Magnetoglobus multicellularis str. Araruama TaxID=890399 RepID=A0A1V1PCP8_9BACT|nr:MAG: hypothetical protein OMM_01609 [Candidatus Magnetoglobus multicellularis str. Araruama]
MNTVKQLYFILYVVMVICLTIDLEIANCNEYPILFNDQDVPFNYNYEVRIFSSRKQCIDKDGTPITYNVYSKSSALTISDQKYSPTALWAKVVQGKIDRSLCAPGQFINYTVRFHLKSNLFGEKRIIIVVANSEKLSLGMGGWKIWYTLIHTMINCYAESLPVSLVALNEDNRMDFVVQAEDIVHMQRSYRLTNPYPQLTQQIKSRITMDQQIVHPMKSLYAVHDSFKDKIKKVIYITDFSNVPDIQRMRLNPNYAKIPLHWNNNGILLSVITNGRCHAWKKVHAKCYKTNTLRIAKLKQILHEK